MAPWTKILMADGIERKISDIRIGDFVQGKEDRIMRVVNVWCDPEREKMAEMLVEGQCFHGSLFTKNHPIWVKEENGVEDFKPAGACRAGDYILVKRSIDVKETWVPIIEVVEREPSDRVLNLDLEPLSAHGVVERGSMFCEGILTGDNQVQNRLGR